MKEKKQMMSDRRVEQIQELAAKIEEDLREMDIAVEDELEVFAEAVSLLIIHWSRTSGWTPIETASYAGYVMSNFMEKGIGAVIKDLKTFTNERREKGN